MKSQHQPEPSWEWGTAAGSRRFDREVDRSLSLSEKLHWLEEAEELSLRFQSARAAKANQASEDER